jgi:hypothetical protein
MMEALWLRSLDEARERVKIASRSVSAAQHETTALEGKVTALTAALAESRATASERESGILASLRECLELREQVRRLTALLAAEQQLRARERDRAEFQERELAERRSEVRALRRRRLAARVSPRSLVLPTGAPAFKSLTLPLRSRPPKPGTKKRSKKQ